MTGLERAWNFDRELQERSAGRVEPFAFGAALYTDDLPRVYDANFVRFDRVDLPPEEAAALADSLQSELPHRKLLLPDAGAELAEGMRALGFDVTRTVVMAYEGPAERGASVAEQVDVRAVRGVRLEIMAGRDPLVSLQVADYTERLALANRGVVYAAFAEGSPASFCVLFADGGVAEIDEVTTLARYQRRGLAGAAVEAALAASLAAGNALTFLVADDSDWPKDWYARLGFRTIGHRYEVFKEP